MASKPKAPSGHDARSAKTREHLLEATIEVIGSVGYEAASTRVLAKAANANLSAIPYHFGGKKELYLAAAQMIADYARGRFEEIGALLDGGAEADPRRRFEGALIHLLHIVLEDAEPHSWTSFFARCTYDKDEAFELIHTEAIKPLVNRLALAARDMSASKAEDEIIRLRVSAIVTVIMSFRFLRGIVLRSIDGDDFQGGHVAQFEVMVRDLCRAIFSHDLI
ncbi:CerR family C-terminal domain-containing protein [Xanthobacter flavus]|uniref:CerR family C-terminal domain-containing protein n=1 Tax=Xanthobacter flavus TaxID=281 RepID=UPI003729E2E2